MVFNMNIKTLAPALLLTALALAGCTSDSHDGDGHPHDAMTMKFNQIQCQDYPWGEPTAEAIAAHYDVKVTEVSEKDDGMAYTTVCDSPNSNWVVATVEGHVDDMKADGWVEGDVTPSSSE